MILKKSRRFAKFCSICNVRAYSFHISCLNFEHSLSYFESLLQAPGRKESGRKVLVILLYLYSKILSFNLKGPSQPLPFSMPSKLFTLLGEAKSYCFSVSCVPAGMFDYL